MEQKALGLVETLGLVPAIEGADAAVKSADVELTGLEMIGAGLVTIKIVGDISAVSSAVDAGKAAATRVGTVRSSTVIGRTGEGLETVLEPRPGPEKTAPVTEPETVTSKAPETKTQEVIGKPLEAETEPVIDKAPDKKAAVKKTVDRAALKNMSVVKLRQFARKLPGLPLAQKKIKYARKKELIEAIVEYHRNEEK
ncbi:MAG: BMC domain-containing protein [Desulfobacteraceae bacterium]|nr:BMC domain-containing protein [Desulfobacteraceae bacterium]